MTAQKADQMLFRFRSSDTSQGVSRATLEQLAAQLGCSHTQVMHYALKRLAKEVLPAYEADAGELTSAQLAAIRKAEPQGRNKSVKSSLF